MSEDLEQETSTINESEVPIAENDIPEQTVAVPAYDGTAKDMIVSSSQDAFNNFVSSNYTLEQKEAIYRQIEKAKEENNGTFTATWNGRENDEFDKIKVTYCDGKMTRFEMHNRDKTEASQLDRHIEYKEKKHSSSLEKHETIKVGSETQVKHADIKGHDDNRFRGKEYFSSRESETDINLKSPSHKSSKSKESHMVYGDRDGSLALKDKTSARSLELGETNEFTATGSTHHIKYDSEGREIKTKNTQTSMQLGHTNQFTTERTTNTTEYTDKGDVAKTKTAQTNVAVGEENGFNSTTHAERNIRDDEGSVIATRVTDNSLTIDERGLNEQYRSTKTVTNEDGTQIAQTTSLGVEFDGTTVTGAAGLAKKEIASDGAVVEEYSRDLALSAGRVTGVQVDITNRDTEHESHITIGAKAGAGALGATYDYAYKDDKKEIRTQMRADYDLAMRQAEATVNLTKKQNTAEGAKEKSFSAGAHIDGAHVDIALNNQSKLTDNDGNVLAQNNTHAGVYVAANQTTLNYSRTQVNENGTKTHTLDAGYTIADGKAEGQYKTSHHEKDAAGNATIDNSTEFAVAGSDKGFTAETRQQRGDHVVENNAHADISGLPDAGISHTVTDKGEVAKQMQLDTDRAYAILGDLATKGIEQITGMTQQTENALVQTRQSASEIKTNVRQISNAMLWQKKINTM